MNHSMNQKTYADLAGRGDVALGAGFAGSLSLAASTESTRKREAAERPAPRRAGGAGRGQVPSDIAKLMPSIAGEEE